ncbi:hypothetical protein CYMTET_28510 [Cymbomonas tetramitiformis]|uniref:Uncharacterized protein n=1 Tax=Cymbomonas tetramitiformis TaxID=36881 RepID=A0AAE0FMS2_9CHLO|nr:hypothetical protein CYMTET_28510 [Cymbomonas tetramitiformis]
MEKVALPENHSASTMLPPAEKTPQIARIASFQQTAPQQAILKPELTRSGEGASDDHAAVRAAALPMDEGTALLDLVSTTKMSLAEKVAARKAACHTPSAAPEVMRSRGGEGARDDDDGAAVRAAALPIEEGTALPDPVSTTKIGLVAARQAACHTPSAAPEVTRSRGGEGARDDDAAVRAAALPIEEGTAFPDPVSTTNMSLAEKVAGRKAACHTPSAAPEVTRSRGGEGARDDDDDAAVRAAALPMEEGTALPDPVSAPKISLAEQIAARQAACHTPSAPEVTRSRGGEAAHRDADAIRAHHRRSRSRRQR